MSRRDATARCDPTIQDYTAMVAQFVDSVSERADGIFLWVEIILKQLLQAMEKYENEATVTEVLQAAPDGLEDLFMTREL